MAARKRQRPSVIAVFETRHQADRAIADLKAAGFPDHEIGMVHKNAEGKVVRRDGNDDTYADEGAVAGAVAGAGAGALIGAGVIAGVIPVVGPVLAVGALGTILLNAAGGAALAGIAGALIGWGIPEEDAEFYETEVTAGRFLVTVAAARARVPEARAVLRRAGGHDRAGWEAVLADREYHAQAGTDYKTLRLREERLRAEKEERKVGEVEVRKEVRTERKTMQVPVEREEVVVTRRPAHGHHAAGADIKAEEIHIPVSEERVHVTKEAVPTEEVTVSKHRVRGTKTVSGEVRKEEVVVDTDGDAHVRHTSDTHGKK